MAETDKGFSVGFEVKRFGLARDCETFAPGARCKANHPKTAAPNIKAANPAAVSRQLLEEWDSTVFADEAVFVIPELVSRCNRLRSALSSAPDWQRVSRSFSRALLMISSSLGGTREFNRVAGGGVRFRMASKITPEVSPRKGSMPVHISYRTAPKENRSVRPSRSFPRTCSGLMYATVPMAVPGLVRFASTVKVGAEVAPPSSLIVSLARPKSSTLA